MAKILFRLYRRTLFNQFESYTNYSSSFKITHNNNEYTITNKEPYYYELNSPIILNKNTSNTFELTGISSYPYYVILLEY